MIDKLKEIKVRYDDLCSKIADPEVIADNKNWQKIVKEKSGLDELMNIYDEMLKAHKAISLAQEVLDEGTDLELKEMFEEEIYTNKHLLEELEAKAKIELLPKDENDEKNVIIEIRAGAGGDEAGIFGKDLMKMYIRYAERRRWKVEVMSVSDTEAGGIKEATFMISGKGAFKNLKYESGVHRVQRVPETETQGRVHTSTATVAVLPEQEEVEFEIQDKDIRIDTYRASGAGGQHVNKTESAIRITHYPTGLVVTCQDERSQHKNRDRAMKILKSKLYDLYQSQADKAYADNRKIQIGTGDRSEKIRTYNYPQSRITDHRINYTTHDLINMMDGDIQPMIEELMIADQKAKLGLVD